MENSYHIPVMLKECIDALAIKSNGTYVDVTFGGGGHSKEIIKNLGADGILAAFDHLTSSMFQSVVFLLVLMRI